MVDALEFSRVQGGQKQALPTGESQNWSLSLGTFPTARALRIEVQTPRHLAFRTLFVGLAPSPPRALRGCPPYLISPFPRPSHALRLTPYPLPPTLAHYSDRPQRSELLHRPPEHPQLPVPAEPRVAVVHVAGGGGVHRGLLPGQAALLGRLGRDAGSLGAAGGDGADVGAVPRVRLRALLRVRHLPAVQVGRWVGVASPRAEEEEEDSCCSGTRAGVVLSIRGLGLGWAGPGPWCGGCNAGCFFFAADFFMLRDTRMRPR